MKKVLVLCFAVFSLMILPVTSNAYQLNGSKIFHPTDAAYWIHDSFNDYSLRSEVKSGILAWNSSPKIQFVTDSSLIGGTDVKIEYLNINSGDTYGVHRGSGHITLYKKWRLDLDKTRRIETVVHEVGHALGLAHTQKANDDISVMRQYNFNDKTTPLSDDYAGINKIY